MEPLLAVFAGYALGGGGVIAAGPKLETLRARSA